jgi:UDP-2-acetamido-2,6-beta-L-arabino-hexul-4-ose reductase
MLRNETVSEKTCRILVTGANGFIGKNLVIRLLELPDIVVDEYIRSDDPDTLLDRVNQVDAIVHLAGENRPDDDSAFMNVNARFTEIMCDAIRASARHIPLIFSSSSQAEIDNAYGRSKRIAEITIQKLVTEIGSPATILRLPGVFGKWSRPNYNSVVATFCYNIARGLPIRIDNESASIDLVYVDDVVDHILAILRARHSGLEYVEIKPKYTITLGDLVSQIEAFKFCRTTLLIERVGIGLVRALYATYVSFLPNESFAYELPQYVDSRGVFVELLKTPDSGQFSYFTAHPGVTRGGHYHHTKTEKFLVIRGRAHFQFRHLITDEFFELVTCGDKPQVVDTIPGWAHDITNIGDVDLIVMLWASEFFDRDLPDTVASKV